MLANLADTLLAGQVRCTPKHIMTAGFATTELGVEPAKGDPGRDQFIADQALARHAMGVATWLSNAYPQLVAANNTISKDMASPSVTADPGCTSTLAAIRHAISHLNFPKVAGSGSWIITNL